MDESAKSNHDFDWVSATEECSIACKFARLQSAAQNSTESRNTRMKERNKFTFGVHSEKCFFIRFLPGYRGGYVKFSAEEERIIVKNDQGDEFKVTLALNDDGCCRYKIDGEGEYLRWEFVRKALKNLLFTGQASF